jgi:RNA polymerase sigma-70 factor (sigma-E family)
MGSAVDGEFAEFVALRSHALLRVAYTLTGDQHTAEDLIQTALAKAFVAWRRIHGEPEPYVRRIIYREHANGWRRRGRRSETLVAEVPEPGLESDPADGTYLRLALRTALLSLPPRQRAVLILRYVDDLTVEQAAEVLGCRPGTVASQASRALAKLRALVPGLAGAEMPEGMLQ